LKKNINSAERSAESQSTYRNDSLDIMAIAINNKIKEISERLSNEGLRGERKNKVIINHVLKLLSDCYSDESLLCFSDKYRGSFDHKKQGNNNDLIRRIAAFVPMEIETRGENKNISN